MKLIVTKYDPLLEYNATSVTTSTADPLSAETPQLSPYAWCADNPIRNTEPTGRLASDVQ
jgi:hypothetical protein